MYRRMGLSLIELLVTMALFSLLFCLLVPALTHVREAARRAQCLNHLRQIGFSLHNYNDAFGSLPPGVVNSTGPIRNENKGYHHSWITSILPYLDQSPLYKKLDPKLSIYDDENLVARRVMLPVLLCPSDDSPKVSSVENKSVALSNYVGNHHPVASAIDFDNHGVLFLNSRVKNKDIYDGTTHTFLVGEALRNIDHLGWASGTRSTLRNGGIGNNTITPQKATPLFDFQLNEVAKIDPEINSGEFDIIHPGVYTFLLCDGSVRAVNINLDLPTFQKLLDRADGQQLSKGW